MPAIMIEPLSAVAPATPTTTPAVDTMPSLAPRTAARSQFQPGAQTLPVGLVVVVELVVGSGWPPPDRGTLVSRKSLKARGRWCRQPRLDSRRTGIAQEGTGQTTGHPRSTGTMSNDSKTAAPKLQRLDGSPVRVLVVDDEANLTELLGMALRYEGWEVRAAGSGMEAVRAAREFDPDAVVLDMMLPDFDGLEVLRRMRTENPNVPVLFLTAKDAVEDRVSGLTAGGDDYVTKPFSLEEVVARVRALMRRTTVAVSSTDSVLVVGDLTLDEDSHEVCRGGGGDPPDRHEFELLRYLMRNPRRVLSKAQILDRVWNYDFGGQANVVELYISYLRKKIDAGRDPMIHTMRGAVMSSSQQFEVTVPEPVTPPRTRGRGGPTSSSPPPSLADRAKGAFERAGDTDTPSSWTLRTKLVASMLVLFTSSASPPRSSPSSRSTSSSIGQIDEQLRRRSQSTQRPGVAWSPQGRWPRALGDEASSSRSGVNQRSPTDGRPRPLHRRARGDRERRDRRQADNRRLRHARLAAGWSSVDARPATGAQHRAPVIGLSMDRPMQRSAVLVIIALAGWPASSPVGVHRHVDRAPQPRAAARGRGHRDTGLEDAAVTGKVALPNGSSPPTPTPAPRWARSGARSTRCSTTSTRRSTPATRASSGCASSSPTPRTSCARHSPRSRGYAELSRREPAVPRVRDARHGTDRVRGQPDGLARRGPPPARPPRRRSATGAGAGRRVDARHQRGQRRPRRRTRPRWDLDLPPEPVEVRGDPRACTRWWPTSSRTRARTPRPERG